MSDISSVDPISVSDSLHVSLFSGSFLLDRFMLADILLLKKEVEQRILMGGATNEKGSKFAVRSSVITHYDRIRNTKER